MAKRKRPPNKLCLVMGRNCPDCGEDLAAPHVLGPHLPGCEYTIKVTARATYKQNHTK